MSDDDRTPSVDEIKHLHGHISKSVQIWRVVPSRLQGDLDKMALMQALRRLECIRNKDGGIQVRKWPHGMLNILGSLFDLSQQLVPRWGLTPFAELIPYPGGGWQENPLPESPLTVEVDELLLLSNAAKFLETALVAMPPKKSEAPKFGVVSDPDEIIHRIPSNAVDCSQAQIARALGIAERGGLAKDLRDQDVLTFLENVGGRWWAVVKNTDDHKKLRDLVAQEKQKRRDRRKNPPPTVE
jgi:hypothetical protein